MATQMQQEVFWGEIARPAGIFWKKNQQSRFRLNCNVFTDVDNRERVKELDKNKEDKFRW